MTTRRRLPIGAEPTADGTSFRVWAPRRARVEVLDADSGRAAPLAAEPGGWFSALVPGVRAGTRYRYRLDGGDAFPDPASRFQPEGPHGPSEVIDPAPFAWTDRNWTGLALEGQVLYELHVGAFTTEGSWAAAARELPELAAAGITTVEMMPVADFPGRFGWGYDGVNLFAPTHLYGRPDDLRAFVDAAHAVGLAVILDVVYNHFGPDGNYLREFSEHFFSDRHTTDWGEAINFDGPDAGPVRDFYLANARYWIEEFHFDGLRLDATQDIRDDSDEHILAAVTRTARAAAPGRNLLLIAENEPQDARLARPVERGGYGLDALWDDDFHHSAVVALLGRDEAYYSDYCGEPQEFVSSVKWGFLYQGQWYSWQKARRGQGALDLRPAQFVRFIQNHDQVANSARGERLHQLAAPGRWRAMTALLLLAPGTPMLFMGQEFSASSPFPYFADHDGDLGGLVRRGRLQFLSQFPSLALPEMQAQVPDPSSPDTFRAARLDLRERETHAGAYQLHRDLLALRRSEAALRAQRPRGVDGAVLGESAFVLRFFADADEDRLLIVNLGRTLHLSPAPEPLLAPLGRSGWQIRWSSEDPRYGGGGTPELETADNWRIPAEAAVLLAPAS
ncbi:MAG: malto-oligosyltrehalose trehalohydrolase [Bacillota bacterium]|jgi:maltooligosyltrehalose trehalohydrolase